MRYLLLALISLTLSIQDSWAETNQNTQQEQGFKAAKRISDSTPMYPKQDLYAGYEGWVVLSIIVDKQGNVKEPLVLGSSGRKNFEDNAKLAAMKFKYEPASLNGEPVESAINRVMISFSIVKDKVGANSLFIKHYQRLEKNIARAKLARMDTKIEKLERAYTRNRYEQAWINILKASYYNKTKDHKPYLQALTKAAGFSRNTLPSDVHANNLINLYNAQIKAGKIKGALRTVERAEKIKSEQARLKKIIDHKSKMLAQVSTIPTLKTYGSITAPDKPWTHQLLRNTVDIKVNKGQVDQIELRCRNGLQKFDAIEASQHIDIPKDWKDCIVFISSEKESEFEIAESLQ